MFNFGLTNDRVDHELCCMECENPKNKMVVKRKFVKSLKTWLISNVLHINKICPPH